jgi:SAM-dependent methyltransferase
MPDTSQNISYYQKISHLYDLMYNQETGYDHQAQVAWVDGWRARSGLSKQVLDLACGTGKHLACFEALGYVCTGIDGSEAMLQIAATRVHDAQLQQGYFQTFSLSRPVALITAFFNAMGYNKDRKALRATCQNVFDNLSSGGLFVFDMVCVDAPQVIFKVKMYQGEGLRFSRTFSGLPTEEGFKSTMVFVVFDGKSTEVIEETTLRGIFAEADVVEILEAVGFKVLHSGPGYVELPTFVAQKMGSN